MGDYEAAAAVLQRYTGDRFDPIETIVTRMFAAQFVANYGCAECDGIGEVFTMPDIGDYCGSEHVKLVNLFDGTTVYADPARCEWRCQPTNRYWISNLVCDSSQNPAHSHCGWVPVYLGLASQPQGVCEGLSEHRGES